jgi:hypothetical protein
MLARAKPRIVVRSLHHNNPLLPVGPPKCLKSSHEIARMPLGCGKAAA